MKLKLLSLGLASLFVANGAMAVSNDFTTSVTVQNALTLTEDTALSFGTIRAQLASDVTGGAESAFASLTISPDGSAVSTTPGTTSVIQSMEDGEPAAFSVGGAANYALLTVTVTADSAGITTGAPGTPVFTMSNFAGFVTTGANPNTDFVSGDQVRTSADGSLSFNLGATITVDQTLDIDNDEASYNDAPYSGSYTVEVDY
ncbi:DUF4402 domain-containing protein [Catenovulum sp. 2E275]|uniref:DUF4402 domain-containing protein n=1 Tax=Catenovulum sp. 2E275 TaxID=2980497 RepID=UPI0021CEE7A1|nr:DUF4402 domain-containing protein [Catenovulum sp. 2E275]MCU4677441.1 DUF4402 domain-containing protein [Catenovulum sp. 2E275]